MINEFTKLDIIHMQSRRQFLPKKLHAETELFKTVSQNNRIILIPILNCGT